MRRFSKTLFILSIGVLFTAFYCEYLIYYIVAAQCSWPRINNLTDYVPLKAFILADIHLLGPKKGHWFDKWRREWQMHQAYEAIVALHQPDVVFVLGDLFDEGEWSNDHHFQAYVNRFHTLFPVPADSAMHVVAGNHDIGFHNALSKSSVQRFEKDLNSSVIQFISLKDNHFLLINSMAMEGDRCSICVTARNDLIKYSSMLKCAEDSVSCHDGMMKINYSRPILMQHFPLHRLSDANCIDRPPLPEKKKRLRTRFDTLTAEATEFLATNIKPRVVFGGHTHHGCERHHTYTSPDEFDFYEYSVPSFSWRNRPNPKYLLVTFTPNEYSITMCALPHEYTIAVAAASMMFMVAYQTVKSGR